MVGFQPKLLIKICLLQTFTLTSKMFDIDVLGYEQSTKNKLHLFDVDSIDESLVSSDSISFDKTQIAKNLTLFLYPDDSDEAGHFTTYLPILW